MPLDNQKKLSDNLSNVLRKNRIDFLINAAAFTNVNGAEDNESLAFEVNANALLTICKVLNNNHNNTVLIHFSTDYVFSGSNSKPLSPDS